mmetsp:Transcript_4460/g.28380  ORF Transcript_4460/g.28380 Transcript_4460/m.28380 type:complete len:221 (-) Transcript_4460:105-767(-)
MSRRSYFHLSRGAWSIRAGLFLRTRHPVLHPHADLCFCGFSSRLHGHQQLRRCFDVASCKEAFQDGHLRRRGLPSWPARRSRQLHVSSLLPTSRPSPFCNATHFFDTSISPSLGEASACSSIQRCDALFCAPSHVSSTRMVVAVHHTPRCTGTVWRTTKQQRVQDKRQMMDTMKEQHNLNPTPRSRAHQPCCRNGPWEGWLVHNKMSNKSILRFHLVLSM